MARIEKNISKDWTVVINRTDMFGAAVGTPQTRYVMDILDRNNYNSPGNRTCWLTSLDELRKFRDAIDAFITAESHVIELKELTRTANGVQLHDHGSRRWRWTFKCDGTYDDILKCCKNTLMKADRDEHTYKHELDNSHDFKTSTAIITGGWYKLSWMQKEDKWEYIVHFDYLG